MNGLIEQQHRREAIDIISVEHHPVYYLRLNLVKLIRAIFPGLFLTDVSHLSAFHPPPSLGAEEREKKKEILQRIANKLSTSH
jgi:hypothetical protein